MWDLIVSVPDHCLSFYSVRDRNPPLSISLQHLIICFICDVYRAYPSPLCWGNFTNYIFSISLAIDFLLTLAF